MANIALPFTFGPNTLIKSADVNADLAEIQTKYNAGAVQTDVAKTITVGHTFTAPQTMSGGVVGNVTGSAGSVAAANLTGAALAAGVTSSSLTGVGILAAPHMTAPVIDSGGLSMPAQGISSTNWSVTGGGAATFQSVSVVGAFTGIGTVQAAAQAADLSQTTVTPVNTSLLAALGASQVWKLDFDVIVGCNNTGGIVLQLTVPAGSTGRVGFLGPLGGATAINSGSFTALGTAMSFVTFNTGGSGYYARITVYIVTAGTPGNATMQYSSAVGGQTSTLYLGSTLLATRIS